MSDDSGNERPVVADPWTGLRRYTAARIAQGRAGVSLPTRAHLEFQLAHARARDAVHLPLDRDTLKTALEEQGWPVLTACSRAPDRAAYLQRPDWGRRLDPAARRTLETFAREQADAPQVVLVVADGLSAFGVQENAPALLAALKPRLQHRGLWPAPVVVVEQGRVAIGDEIGAMLGARLVAVLIGERPGLSSPDSLGVYLTFGPRVGCSDAERNCLSNIRREGLQPAAAADRLDYLFGEALVRELTGVALKDEAVEAAIPGGPGSGDNFLTRE